MFLKLIFKNCLFIFIKNCFIQPTFVKHQIYADSRLSTEAKTVNHYYWLQRSQLERHTYK